MTASRRRFSQEFKDELCLEVISTSKTIKNVADAYGVGTETLRKLLIQLRSGKVGSEFDHVVSHGGVIDRAFDQVVEDEADLCCRAPVPSEAELVEVLL